MEDDEDPDYSFLFKDASFGGEGSAYIIDYSKRNRDNDRKGNGNGGAPDDNDPDDNDEGDDDFPNGDRHSFTGSSNTQTSNAELRPRSKLPNLHHKSLQWDGVKAKLRIYIIR